jgi:hypothetical protein
MLTFEGSTKFLDLRGFLIFLNFPLMFLDRLFAFENLFGFFAFVVGDANYLILNLITLFILLMITFN